MTQNHRSVDAMKSTEATKASDHSAKRAASKLMQTLLACARKNLLEVLSTLRMIQQSRFVLLVVNCATAEEMSDCIQEALSRVEILQQSATLLVFNQHPTVLEGHKQVMEALLSTATVTEMDVSVQDFSAEEGYQQVEAAEPVLLEALLSSSRPLDVAADKVVAHVRQDLESRGRDLRAQDLSLKTISNDELKAAVFFVGRDILASWEEDGVEQQTTSIQYVNDCDPTMDGSLSKALGRHSEVPGVCILSRECVTELAECMGEATFGGKGKGSALVKLVGALPSNCMWPLILLDPVHLARLMLNLDDGIPWVSGVNTTTLIVSQAMTSTFRHREDYSLSSLNWLIYGAIKHWILVSQNTNFLSLDYLKQHKLHPETPYLKCAMASFVKAGVDSRDLSMLMQPSGILVVTRAGASMHQTLSTGVSFAESGNSWMGYEQAGDALAANLAVLAQEDVEEKEAGEEDKDSSTGLRLARIYSEQKLADA